jgi:hypothetical protein
LAVVLGALASSNSTTKFPIVVLNSTFGPAKQETLARRLVITKSEAMVLRMVMILKKQIKKDYF